MKIKKLKNILEAILLSADKPMTVAQLDTIFDDDNAKQGEDRPKRDEIRDALKELEKDYTDRAYELKQVASGYRLQVGQDYSPWVARLWEDRPARYSRALLETIALIAYRQPITRGEIEEVRGVSVSSNIVKTLVEREWIKILGHKDVPGKPALYGTTREFLDYFDLKSLDQLPELADIKDIDQIYPELAQQNENVKKNDEQSGEDVDEDAKDDDDTLTDETANETANEAGDEVTSGEASEAEASIATGS